MTLMTNEEKRAKYINRGGQANTKMFTTRIRCTKIHLPTCDTTPRR